MANFWRSFQEGQNAVKNAYDTYEQISKKKAIGEASKTDQTVSDEYSPEQLAKLRDPAEQAGGKWDAEQQNYVMPDTGERVIPTGTPTWEDGAYQTAQGERIAPQRKYSLGGVTRDTAFTQEEIQSARDEAVARAYGEHGDYDKAVGLRASAQQLKLGAVQLDEAKQKQAFQKEFKDYFKKEAEIRGMAGVAISEFNSEVGKDPIAATRKLAAFYNSQVPDGNHVYVNDSGTIHMAGDDGKGADTAHNVYNPTVQRGIVQQLTGAIDSHLKSAMPVRDFDQWRAMRSDDREDRKFVREGEQFDKTLGLSRDKFIWDKESFQTSNDLKVAMHNDEMGLKRDQLAQDGEYKRGIVAAYGRGGKGGSGNTLDISDDQRARLQELVTKHAQTTDPKERARIVQDYNLLTNQIAVQNEKFPSLGGLAKEPKEVSLADLKAAEEVLRLRDPNFDSLSQARKDELRNALLGNAHAPTSVTVPPAVERAPSNQSGGNTAPSWLDRMLTAPEDSVVVREGLRKKAQENPLGVFGGGGLMP